MGESFVRSIAVSRDIAARASVLFDIIANPAMHPLLDGTGMAQRGANDEILTKVGDVFEIHMTHWSLGDYGMENCVVDFEANRRIVWQPRAHTYQTSEFPGDPNVPEVRYWGWELEPLAQNLTRVTEFFDGSRLSEGLRHFIRDGEFWRKGMLESLLNLERLATATATATGVVGEEPTHGFTAPAPNVRRNYFEEVQRMD